MKIYQAAFRTSVLPVVVVVVVVSSLLRIRGGAAFSVGGSISGRHSRLADATTMWHDVPHTTGGAARTMRTMTLTSRTATTTTTTTTRQSTTSTSLSMIFDRLLRFLTTGGAAGTRIDYSVLDHPGPELAAAAQAGEILVTSPRNPHLAIATFAGGCFWGLELAYQRVPGVEYTAVGYVQGPEPFPTYSQVCSGSTGHTEAVIVYFDPAVTTYDQLLDTFLARVNPTTVNGQGNDFGKQYRTGIYFHTPEQEQVARTRLAQEQLLRYNKKAIATEIQAVQPFWPAEKYHQQYLEKGGNFGQPQNASKGAMETIRCYG